MPLGFDERFRRMWLYYLAYCEAGFSTGASTCGRSSTRSLTSPIGRSAGLSASPALG